MLTIIFCPAAQAQPAKLINRSQIISQCKVFSINGRFSAGYGKPSSDLKIFPRF